MIKVILSKLFPEHYVRLDQYETERAWLQEKAFDLYMDQRCHPLESQYFYQKVNSDFWRMERFRVMLGVFRKKYSDEKE